MNKTILIGIAALVVIGAGAYYVISNSSNNTPTASNTTQNNTPSQSPTSSNNQKTAATITYTSNGFSPSSTTVKSGDTVEIKNTSDEDMQLDSNPHPIHDDDADLNVGAVGPGESKTFVVTKKGTFGFHNHLDPGDTGTIIVQ